MPVLMPTPDELAHLPRHKRERIRRAVLAILTDVDTVTEHAFDHAQQLHTWGESVRAEARALEETIPHESPRLTSARRQALLDATR